MNENATILAVPCKQPVWLSDEQWDDLQKDIEQNRPERKQRAERAKKALEAYRKPEKKNE